MPSRGGCTQYSCLPPVFPVSHVSTVSTVFPVSPFFSAPVPPGKLILIDLLWYNRSLRETPLETIPPLANRDASNATRLQGTSSLDRPQLQYRSIHAEFQVLLFQPAYVMLGIPWLLQLDGLPQGATLAKSTLNATYTILPYTTLP